MFHLLQAISDMAREDILGQLSLHSLTFSNVERRLPNQAVEFCAVQAKEKRHGSSPR